MSEDHSGFPKTLIPPVFKMVIMSQNLQDSQDLQILGVHTILRNFVFGVEITLGLEANEFY